MIRFTFDPEKAIDAIEFIAREKPGLSQYYVGKILFFADREHILDYGRPITGDRYVAMKDGPVPSAVRKLLNGEYAGPMAARFFERVNVNHKGNLQLVYAKADEAKSRLSGSDKEYLRESIAKHAHLTYGELRDLSHEDAAWAEAWERDGSAAEEMNAELWLEELDNADAAKAELVENRRCVA